MKEVLDELFAAYQAGNTTAMATVVRTWRSAPRPAGASMMVTAGGEAVGSVSGGCIEVQFTKWPAKLLQTVFRNLKNTALVMTMPLQLA